MNRRSFYQRAVIGLGALINAAIALPALAYLFLPGKQKAAAGWTDAGSVRALPTDEPSELTIQRERQDSWKTSVEKLTVWAVKKSDAEVVVYSPACTHLGCGYHWVDDDQHFICPCHDSAFGKDGSVLYGPAPRPLDRFQTRVEGGRLWLGPVGPDEKA